MVGLTGILFPHFVLRPTKLAHGSERSPADVLMGKLESEGEYRKKGQVTAQWVVLHKANK